MKFVNVLSCALMAISSVSANLFFTQDTKLYFDSTCSTKKIEAYNCLYNDSDNHVKCMYYNPPEDVYHIEIPITKVEGMEYCNMRGWSQFSKSVLSKYDAATDQWYETDKLFTRKCGVTAGANQYEGGKQRFDVWTPKGCHFALEYDTAYTLKSY